MSIGSYQDYENFDDWESFTFEDDIYVGTESDLLDDWEDDGAIAEIRETPITKVDEENAVELDEESAEVFSLLERANTKREAKLDGIEGPSEDELSKIEKIGIDDYIDEVLNEESAHSETDSDEAISLKVADSQDEEAIQGPVVVTEIFEDESAEISLTVQPIFEGVAACIPTLFDEDGEAEFKTTARLAKRLSSNVSAIFVATPTGEGQTLTIDEHKQLINEVAKALPETILVADVSAPSIRQTLVLAKNAVDAKADALIVELSSDVRDPYALCNAIHDKHHDTPLLVRLTNDPRDLPITPEFLYDIPINGVIDETGSAEFMLQLASVYTGPIYSGSISTILLASALGLSGVVSASATISQDLVESAFTGNVEAQLQLASDERDFGGFSAMRIKQVLSSQDLVSDTTRD